MGIIAMFTGILVTFRGAAAVFMMFFHKSYLLTLKSE
jgi:hypothetical protein